MKPEYLIACIVFGLIASSIYQSKGRNAVGGFLAGFVLGPIGIVLTALSSPVEDVLVQRGIAQGKLKLCPYCAEPIQAAAILCKHCHSDVGNYIPEKRKNDDL